MNDLNPFLGDPNSKGRYHPKTDHIELHRSLPKNFPDINFDARNPEEIENLATIIEELVHRFQFCLTQVGLLYRLSSLVQSIKSLEILKILAADPTQKLFVPWIRSTPQHKELAKRIDDIKTLDKVKLMLLGFRIEGDLKDAMANTKQIIENNAPLKLGCFDIWDLNTYYESNGQPKLNRSTRAIFESHASAFAYKLLENEIAKENRKLVYEHIRRNRCGLYRSIEEIAEKLKMPVPVSLELKAIIRLGDYAIDGKYFDFEGIPPPADYISAELPYVRYSAAIKRVASLQNVKKIIRKELPISQAVDIAIDILGDKKTYIFGKSLEEGEEHRHNFFNGLIQHALNWSDEYIREKTEFMNPDFLEIADQIATTIACFFRGVKIARVDGKKFDPMPEQLKSLCFICNNTVVVSGSSYEILTCRGTSKNPYEKLAEGIAHVRFHIGLYLNALQIGDSELIDRLGLPSLKSFIDSHGVSGQQIAKTNII